MQFLFGIIFYLGLFTAANAETIQQTRDGIIVTTPCGIVKLEVRSPRIIRVLASQDRKFFERKSLVIVPQDSQTSWHLVANAPQPTIDTGTIRASVDPANGHVTFTDEFGSPILSETDRASDPANVQGEQTFHIRQQWNAAEDESLYGLGQHQFDATNLRGLSIDLWQRNTSIVVPMLLSSRGYGIFWDNLSFTRFGDLRDWQNLSGDEIPGGLRGDYFADAKFEKQITTRVDSKIDFDVSSNPDLLSTTQPTIVPSQQKSNTDIHPSLPPGDVSIRWQGSFIPKQTGDYQFHSYQNGGIKFSIGETTLFDHWRQAWLPAEDVAKMHLEAGKIYPLKIEWTKNAGANVFRIDYKPPAPPSDSAISLWSETGGGVDYYFVYGPSTDEIVAGMRDISGRATMPPRWAFGLWQSRQRYETQQASLDVIDGFRSRKIPFDVIVQDWQYWTKDKWGSHTFDPQRFPDPISWINSIHEKHSHLMISVWGKFYRGTQNYDELLMHGFLYPLNIALNTKDWLGFPFTNYDAFNPDARKLFWEQIKTSLLDKGVDAWWMDATEPDMEGTPTLQGLRERINPNAAGTGASVLNGYALQNARAIFEGQRAAAPEMRVLNLTRSGYAGQQRYGAASWSGDITATWSAMRKQIPAGINFCASGVPYWTMDSGGFSVPPQFASKHPTTEATDEWRELETRWFEFATFVPILRVHGEFPNREMWEFGGEDSPAFRAQLKFDRLRYQLFPYVYSLAGNVTQHGGTIMRGLFFDFPNDVNARDVTDEYLFGRALLISPVTQYLARSRSVYLPTGASWYDFWTGKHFEGGERIDADAAFDAIPIFVRAGSIILIGPDQQYIGENPADPITLNIYAGADGDFTLYEDDGLTNNYERNEFTEIPLHWSDAKKTLTIGLRRGNFSGMLERRKFNVVLISPQKAVGFSFEPMIDRTIDYTGDAVACTLQ